MRSIFALLAIAVSVVGCESTNVDNTPNSPNHAYRPVDGRDANFDSHHPNAAAPVWPADSDTGSSSGAR